MEHTTLNVKQEFARYLSLPEWNWTHYITQTFDDRKCRQYSRICEHSWRYFLNVVGKEASMVYGWMFAERGRSGRLHWHALVHLDPNLFGSPSRVEMWDAMFQKYGRNVTAAYEPGEQILTDWLNVMATGVSQYLTKYVAKEAGGGDATWDFGGFISGLEADSAQLCSAIGVPTARP